MLGLVTAQVAASLDPDLLPLDAAMRDRLGDEQVSIVAWDDASVDWSGFDAVIIRSTWDYTERLSEFLDWVHRVEGVTELINGADVVRWSTDKRYLADLAAEGIEITPTVFVAPGEPAPEVEGLHVVKPSVGAGSSGARRCEPGEVAAPRRSAAQRGPHRHGAAVPGAARRTRRDRPLLRRCTGWQRRDGPEPCVSQGRHPHHDRRRAGRRPVRERGDRLASSRPTTNSGSHVGCSAPTSCAVSGR